VLDLDVALFQNED